MLMKDHRRLSLGVLILLVFLTLASSSCSKCMDGLCESNGLCTNGCVVGYADKKCQHRCQSTCKSLKCDVEADTGKTICSEGCQDGYCGVQCKTSCPDGCLQCDRRTCDNCSLCRSSLYGEACQHSCFDKCLGFACDNAGRCQNECMDGYYGVNCTKMCNQNYGKCNMLTGTCIRCRLGFFGDSCEHLCPSCLPTREDIYSCHSGCVVCIVSGKDDVTQVPPIPTLCLNKIPIAIYILFGVCIFLTLLVPLIMLLRLRYRTLLSMRSQRSQMFTTMKRHKCIDNEPELEIGCTEDPEWNQTL